MSTTPGTRTTARFASIHAGSTAEWMVPSRPVSAPVARPLTRARRAPSVGIFERSVAAVGLIGVSPLLLLISTAIKLESPRGPVFFRQERVGLNRRRGRADAARAGLPQDRRKRTGYGQTFMIYKFRTMIPDAERQTGPVWASENDPRITRIGRVLRGLRLDELPQLFNVVGGQMRLIGPRPERPHFVEQLSRDIPEYLQRLTIPPGITGLAQVEREYDSDVSDVRKKVKYDLFYARHQCWLMDVKILLKTIQVVVARRGAH
ncbi:MAG: sugar transferase [Candidatus Eisenbacteria bacterium]